MKVLAIILLFVATGCHAQDTNGITSKVFERDSDKDGKPDLRVETVYRDGTKVMLVGASLMHREFLRSLLGAISLAGT